MARSTVLRSSARIVPRDALTAELELCYAPPVGSAKDLVNMAGMAAQNIVEALISQVEWKDLERLTHESGTAIIDVRNLREIERTGQIAHGAIDIRLNDP